MKRFFTLCVVLVFAISNVLLAQEEEKPLLTFGCLSDLHSQETLISGDVEQIRLRGTVTNTLKAIKQQENLDLLVLGGDYLSDVSISEANYLRMRELLIGATREVFPEGGKTPVMYVNGNHEYEVANFDAIPKKYNAGEYYNTPMKSDIGALDSEDCFYEKADNGNLGTVNLLAAYHYVVKGIDFVVLNTGKNFFGSAWNYVYSDESVKWCADKLAEIYADDKDKTVFFLAHLPFGDSNSISSASKGMSGVSAVMLKRALAQYPNLIMLYGHDHGTNSAFIREATEQRVTVYDSNGDVWKGGEDGSESQAMMACVRNVATGAYLTYDNASNLKTVEARTLGTIERSSVVNGTYSISFAGTPTRFVHCGSSGRFSGNESLSANSSLYVYKVDDATAKSGTAKRVTTIETGASYIFVSLSTSGGYYMLTNETYGSGSGLRMVGTRVSSTVPGDEITFTQTDNLSPVWTIEPRTGEEAPSLYYIQNYTTGQYLGFNSYNLANADVQLSDVTVTPSATKEGALNFMLNNSNDGNTYLYCGSSGRFSGNTDYSNDAAQILAFEVDDPSAKTVTATQTTTITAGKTYLLVCLKSGTYYALSNRVYKEGTSDQRMTGIVVRVSDGKITYTPGVASALWTINEKVTKPGTKSFFSSFMGSMRYYNNSIDGNVSVSNSKIVQALMVYVYSDRVELHMKNYGQSGTINGITVNKELTPHITYRTVTHSEEAVTETPSFSGETGGEIEIGKPVTLHVDAPEWHNVYYTVDGTEPTEESLKAENGVIEWTPESEGEFVVKAIAQEGVRLPSASVSSLTYKAVNTSSAIKDATSSGSSNVTVTDYGIQVCGYVGTVRIYTVQGSLVRETNVSGSAHFTLCKGVYVVSLDSVNFKVVV